MTFALLALNILITMGICYQVRHRYMPVVGSRLPEDDRGNIAEAAFDSIVLHAIATTAAVIMAGGVLV